jgi:diguanylate cyclase (GGDEF)-like protein
MNFIATNGTYLFIASFLVSLLNIHILWQKHREINLTWLVLALYAIALYNLFSLLDASSTTLFARIFWSKLLYLGAAFITPFLLLFFITYPHSHFRLNWRIIISILFIPILTLLAVFTNDLHHLFWTGFVPISGILNGYIFLHGPFYWIGIGYEYLCGLAVMVLIAEDMRHSSGIYRTQSLWLLFSSAFPFISSVVYDLGLTPIPGIEILPVGFSISGLGLVFSIVFLNMFDIIPVSRSLLVENLQDGLIVLDNFNRVVDINPAARHLMGIEQIRSGIEIQNLSLTYSPALLERLKPTEVTSNVPTGKTLLFIPSDLLDESGKPAGAMFMIRDMTAIRAVEKALQQSQSRYQSLIEDVLDISTVGICILDKDFKVVWINEAAVIDWLGDRTYLLGEDFRELIKELPTQGIQNGKRLIGEMLLSYHSGYYMEDVEIHFQNGNGRDEKVLQYTSRPISVGFFQGGRIEQFIDITEQKSLQNKIELLAITDELTGIYNRRGLLEFGRHDFNRALRTSTHLGVIYFDIDCFKELNDKYGHAQGDVILIETIRRVETCLRDMDTFARFGGDEFIIIVPDADHEQCVEIAERILKEVTSSPMRVGDDDVNVNLSLGISQIRPADSLATLLNRADLAMYRAKQTGRGHIELEEK